METDSHRPSVADAQARILALHQTYAAALAESVTAVRDLWQSLRADGWEARRAADLHLRLHRLAGNAGMFGYDELGLIAAGLEEQLFDWCRRPEVSGAVTLDFNEVDRLMAELFSLGSRNAS